MFEGLSKCKFDLTNGFPTAILKQVFSAFKKSQFKNIIIVKELFKEDCVVLVLNLFELYYFIFGFGYCHDFCKGNISALAATC